MQGEGWIEEKRRDETLVLEAGGCWLVAGATALDRRVDALTASDARRVEIDLSRIEALDTVGAWLLLRLERRLAQEGAQVALQHLAPDFAPLLDQVAAHPFPADRPSPRLPGVPDGLAYVGGATIDFLCKARELVGFFGLVVVTVLATLRHPGRVRFVSLVAQMERAGVSALPIVGLLSFLVGVVFAYQGADQLRRFGAEILTANLLGIAFLRELGVLLTAIIVAGRSGSAFTAEIGAMQVNEEVDALRTLGLDPIEVLVLPRLFALVLTLPLLTFYANALGMLGGALMSWVVLGIPLPVFVEQLRGAVTGWTFWLGILKAPFFAVSIALIGCHEGLRVSRSAESVGRLTTLSVVQSIFLVIIIDAAFSILFSRLRV
jgi:phospholipid/cholesterol/gamma-HCH transport system permease protein